MGGQTLGIAPLPLSKADHGDAPNSGRNQNNRQRHSYQPSSATIPANEMN
jgi:hypothetical protein